VRSARQASARGSLALVAVALLALAGCGGGSSGSETTSTTAQVKGEATSQAKGNQRGPASQNPAKQEGNSGASATAPTQGAGKHGQRITLPKGEPEPQATPAEQANATVADIALTSPDVSQGGALPAEFTCDGKDTWPTLQWPGVPTGTKELVIFAMNAQPVDGKLFFDWVLAGITPNAEGIESGKLPKGAVQGQNSFGKVSYQLCPEGQSETYVFALYALPKVLSPAKGFDPSELRQKVQAISRKAGLLAVSYGR